MMGMVNNLLLVILLFGLGDGMLIVMIIVIWDNVGNCIYVDGLLLGMVDMVCMFYDVVW